MLLTKEQVEEKVIKLCEKLGGGWEPRIWHNLYWCYAAVKGKVEVAENDGHYSAYYKPNSIVVGDSKSSPLEAVEDLVSKYKSCYETRLSHWIELQNSLL